MVARATRALFASTPQQLLDLPELGPALRGLARPAFRAGDLDGQRTHLGYGTTGAAHDRTASAASISRFSAIRRAPSTR